jgi:hypothetical protein
MEAYGGPAQPSPTIAQCLNGGYGWLQVKCHRCETEASIFSVGAAHNVLRAIFRLATDRRVGQID